MGLFLGAMKPAVAKTPLTCHYDEVLVMDVWTSYMPAPEVAAFKKFIHQKYQKHIDIQLRQVLKPEDFYDRVRGGISDIISPSHNFFKDERNQFIRKKLLVPVDRAVVTNLEKVQPQFIENDFVKEDGILYGVPVAAGGYTLLYDKNHFKKPPASWSVLWRDDMRGRYALSRHFYEANIYLTVIAMGYKQEDLHNVTLINSAAFKKKLKRLLSGARYWDGAPTQEDLTSVVLTTTWGLSHSVSGENSRWMMAFAKEGVSLWTDYLAVTKNARRNPFALKIAMEWLNFVITPQFQEYIVRTKRYLSPLKLSADWQVPSARDEKELSYLAQQAVYWPVLSTRQRNGLKRIYDQVMSEIQ